jgi:hypothetical protein
MEKPPFDLREWKAKTKAYPKIKWTSNLAGGVTRTGRIKLEDTSEKATSVAFEFFWQFVFSQLKDLKVREINVADRKIHFHFHVKTKPMLKDVRFTVWPEFMCVGMADDLDKNGRFFGNEKSIAKCWKLLESSLKKSKVLKTHRDQLAKNFEIVATDDYDKKYRRVIYEHSSEE